MAKCRNFSGEKNCYFFRGRVTLTIRLEALEGGREALLGGNIKMWETQRYKSAAVGGGKGFHILPFPADLRGKQEYSYFPKKISNILIRSIRIFFIFWKTYFFVFAAIKQAKNTMKRHSKTSFFLVSLRRRSNISPPPSFPHPPLRGDI